MDRQDGARSVGVTAPGATDHTAQLRELLVGPGRAVQGHRTSYDPNGLVSVDGRIVSAKANRTDALASPSESPIARSTCDGSIVPDVQAEPVEAAKCGCIIESRCRPSHVPKRTFEFPG